MSKATWCVAVLCALAAGTSCKKEEEKPAAPKPPAAAKPAPADPVPEIVTPAVPDAGERMIDPGLPPLPAELFTRLPGKAGGKLPKWRSAVRPVLDAAVAEAKVAIADCAKAQGAEKACEASREVIFAALRAGDASAATGLLEVDPIASDKIVLLAQCAASAEAGGEGDMARSLAMWQVREYTKMLTTNAAAARQQAGAVMATAFDRASRGDLKTCLAVIRAMPLKIMKIDAVAFTAEGLAKGGYAAETSAARNWLKSAEATAGFDDRGNGYTARLKPVPIAPMAVSPAPTTKPTAAVDDVEKAIETIRASKQPANQKVKALVELADYLRTKA